MIFLDSIEAGTFRVADADIVFGCVILPFAIKSVVLLPFGASCLRVYGLIAGIDRFVPIKYRFTTTISVTAGSCIRIVQVLGRNALGRKHAG